MTSTTARPKPSGRVKPSKVATKKKAGLAVKDHAQARVQVDVAAEMNDMISILDGQVDEEDQVDGQAWLNRALSLTSVDGLRGGGVFNILQASKKVWLYSNSRLPSLTPFAAYIPTYALCCAAAKYSMDAYRKRSKTASSRASILIPRSVRHGTKAMILTISPCPNAGTPTVLLALRGSASFADWAVNFRQSPVASTGFLDDPANPVHAGFLAVAKKMLEGVAVELENYLKKHQMESEPGSKLQLLLTGHSAGGAVASLLFCHVTSVSNSVSSRLKTLAQQFKRIHCITFGAPPVSLLPLQKPQPVKDKERRWHENMFLALINEGDPVVRADRAYIRSMIDLYIAPSPHSGAVWPVPTTVLSLAGRILVMRDALDVSPTKVARSTAVEIGGTTDTQLRRVVYGDLATHSMRLYQDRINGIAAAKITCS